MDAEVFQANGPAERNAALVMLEQIPGTKSLTVGGDKEFRQLRLCGGIPEFASDGARGAQRKTTAAV